MKGRFDLLSKVKSLPMESLFISEITLAELKFGVANSDYPKKNQTTPEKFLSGIQILPIYECLDIYATEKTRLRKSGIPVDDFDLLIGSTAVAHGLTMVTNNTRHFKRISGVEIEDWTR